MAKSIWTIPIAETLMMTAQKIQSTTPLTFVEGLLYVLLGAEF